MAWLLPSNRPFHARGKGPKMSNPSLNDGHRRSLLRRQGSRRQVSKRQVSGHHPVSDVYQLGIHPSGSNQLIHDGHRVTPCAKGLQVDIGWRLT